MVACIDLFCGAGGLTNGLLSAGVNVVAGVDFEPSCRFPYEFNNRVRFVQEDIAALSSERLGRSFGSASVKILAGCAPCQPFSSVNSNKWPLRPAPSRWKSEDSPRRDWPSSTDPSRGVSPFG